VENGEEYYGACGSRAWGGRMAWSAMRSPPASPAGVCQGVYGAAIGGTPFLFAAAPARETG